MNHPISHLARFAAITFSAVLAITTIAGVADAGSPDSSLPYVAEAPGAPTFTTTAGATPLATDRTVAHWHGQFTDPTNGVTYGYNMVGNADPRSGTAGTTTIGVDIIPLDLHFAANGGYSLNGADAVGLTVASPMFQNADYASAGVSAGNTAVQYEDAVMRSQFNQTGTNGYHLKLGAPVVWPTIRIDVPKNQGSAFINSRSVVFGEADITWFSSRIQNLLGSLNLDPTRLPIFLTDNVMLYFANDVSQCCVIGYHGANKASGFGSGNTGGNGNGKVLTFAYAGYNRPGTFNPVSSPFVTDIHALSHEVAEWGDDPFVNNIVNPWLTPTAPQYGCTAFLETGDPVVGIGFHLPGNPDARARSDGTWHPEDEVFLPWFARENPNHTSQLNQSGTNGRYTFMGDLNPYPGFHQPATGCN